MYKGKIFTLLIALSVTACSQATTRLSINDAENLGFKKDQQQIFQMVGASDGWNGTWSGETVELYEFSDSKSVNRDAFQAATQPNNISGWKEVCITENLLMLSKGKKACRELERLSQ